MPARRESPKRVLERLRKLCLGLPETHETPTWGHPNFRVRKKIFAAFHEDGHGSPCIWLKVDPPTMLALVDDERISPGRHGGARWIGLRADLPLDWKMVQQLAEESYRLTAPKTLAARL